MKSSVAPVRPSVPTKRATVRHRSISTKSSPLAHVRADELLLGRRITIEEVRAMNQAALKRAGTWYRGYKSGDGWRAHVKAKYGQRSA